MDELSWVHGTLRDCRVRSKHRDSSTPSALDAVCLDEMKSRTPSSRWKADGSRSGAYGHGTDGAVNGARGQARAAAELCGPHRAELPILATDAPIFATVPRRSKMHAPAVFATSVSCRERVPPLVRFAGRHRSAWLPMRPRVQVQLSRKPPLLDHMLMRNRLAAVHHGRTETQGP